MKSDPRMRRYLIGGRVLSRSLCRKALREAPQRVVRVTNICKRVILTVTGEMVEMDVQGERC